MVPCRYFPVQPINLTKSASSYTHVSINHKDIRSDHFKGLARVLMPVFLQPPFK